MHPRIIRESDIAVASPCIREIWAYLLREANSKDVKYGGQVIKRGQLLRSYNDIREGTKWFRGYCKMTYSVDQTKKAMKFLRETQRISIRKVPGGVLITICKYDYYQNPKNYESTKGYSTQRAYSTPTEHQNSTIYNNKNKKNNKNSKNEKNIYIEDPEFKKIWNDWREYKRLINDDYQTLRGEKSQFTILKNLSNGDSETARKIVDQSIDNEWRGLFPYKPINNSINKDGNSMDKTIEMYEKIIEENNRYANETQ